MATIDVGHIKDKVYMQKQEVSKVEGWVEIGHCLAQMSEMNL